MDPVSLIVTALVAGATAGMSESASAAVKDAYGFLRERLQRLFTSDAAALAVLDEYALSPEDWDKPLRRKLQSHQADQDPQAVAAAKRILELVDASGARNGRYDVKVSGHGRIGTVGDQSDIHQQGVRAGRDIKMKVDKRRHRTHLALGGGGLFVALVLLFVWQQYSAGKAAAEKLLAYQQGVIAVCQRIEQTGTFDLNFDLGDDGPVIARSGIQRAVERADEVRQEQIADLLRKPYPATLADEQDAVRDAEASVDKAITLFVEDVRTWPRTMSFKRFQQLTEGEAATEASRSYRRLGDSLTRLAGSTCSIERV